MRIAVHRIPAPAEELEELLHNKTAPTTEVVGAESSGDRLFSALTTLEHVVELELRTLWTRQ